LNRKSSCNVILSFIQDLRSFNSEQLPPSWFNTWCGSQVWMSTIGVSFDCMSLPLLISNSLGLLIEPEELILSSLDPSVKVDPSSCVGSLDSSHCHLWSEV
jgi:hypothetical protein